MLKAIWGNIQSDVLKIPDPHMRRSGILFIRDAITGGCSHILGLASHISLSYFHFLPTIQLPLFIWVLFVPFPSFPLTLL